MSNPRRKFLGQLTFMAGVAALNKPITSAAAISKHINTIHTNANAVIIYHTGDLNGNIDAAHKNLGGINNVSKTLQSQDINGLTLDAGGFLNTGSNLYQQKQMLSKMNAAGYHAAGISQNELALGQDHLAALIPSMRFALVNCNYTLNAQLSKLVKPYIIINSDKFKIGITGVGQQLKGIPYNDAVASANNIARILKEEEKCDYVICLSHLSNSNDAGALNNLAFAKSSANIDMIIGGNSVKLNSNISVIKNLDKSEVLLSQTAWNGLLMGRTIINFDSDKQMQDCLKPRHHYYCLNAIGR